MPREVLMQIIEYAVRIVILVVGVYVIKFIKQHKLEKWVDFCVKAAEQLAEAGIIDKKEKKELVRQKVLKKFKITEEELNILIEASVQELNKLKDKNTVVNVNSHVPIH